MGENGRPTQQSLDKLMKAVSKNSGQGGKVDGAYFDYSDKQTADMNKSMESKMAQNSNPDREPYDLTSNNCATFCIDTLKAGGKDVPDPLIDLPNSVIKGLQSVADATVTYDPKDGTTSVEEKKKNKRISKPPCGGGQQGPCPK